MPGGRQSQGEDTTNLGSMIRALRPGQYAADGIAGVVLVLLSLPFIIHGHILDSLVLLGMNGALVLRRISPLLSLTLAWVAVIIQMGCGIPPSFYNVVIPFVLYATARYGRGWVRWYGLSSAIIGGVIASGYVVLIMYATTPITTTDFTVVGFAMLTGAIAGVVVLGLSWTLGQLMRTAATAREAGIARFRADEARWHAERATVVEQERNRIARDMHDVVAHSLAVVIAQADGARYVHKGDPDALAETLETVSSTARHALGDVRLLLSELRHEQDAGPQPGLDEIDSLLNRMRAAGLTISRTQIGADPDLPMGRQIAAYRILQEALTNALHHGVPNSEVTVITETRDSTYNVIIENSVGTSAASGSGGGTRGHGLPGMRERATLAGGTLDIDTSSAGRFRVHAALPIR